jgi:hypothetical protein
VPVGPPGATRCAMSVRAVDLIIDPIATFWVRWEGKMKAREGHGSAEEKENVLRLVQLLPLPHA